MEKITAIIPTFNEERHIADAIASVRWADEVLVVDSLSTDRTLELARGLGARVIQREYGYSASQKNWAIPQASHPWVFLLDADERCTPELESEIKGVLSQGTAHDAFWIHRVNHFMGKRIDYSGWQSDKVVRLFKRDSCRYQDLKVHAEIESSGSISKLRQKILHYTYTDLANYLRKADRYTTWGALDRFEKFQKQGRRIGWPYLIFRPFGRFLRHYVWRLGVLDGTHGLVVSLLSAHNIFIRAVKIWRLQNGEDLRDPFKG
jgi:glycosyltransferase involved in cell wall biosynthesis